jgi:hypothetical protein
VKDIEANADQVTSSPVGSVKVLTAARAEKANRPISSDKSTSCGLQPDDPMNFASSGSSAPDIRTNETGTKAIAFALDTNHLHDDSNALYVPPPLSRDRGMR